MHFFKSIEIKVHQLTWASFSSKVNQDLTHVTMKKKMERVKKGLHALFE